MRNKNVSNSLRSRGASLIDCFAMCMWYCDHEWYQRLDESFAINNLMALSTKQELFGLCLNSGLLARKPVCPLFRETRAKERKLAQQLTMAPYNVVFVCLLATYFCHQLRLNESGESGFVVSSKREKIGRKVTCRGCKCVGTARREELTEVLSNKPYQWWGTIGCWLWRRIYFRRKA